MNLFSGKDKERGESEALFLLLFVPVLIFPVAMISSVVAAPAEHEQTATDTAASAVELLEADEEDFTYSRLAAEALSQEGERGRPDTVVTVTAAGAAPTADAYCVTVTVGEAVINYDSSTEEYTQPDADGEFVCEATPEGWN